MPFEFGNTITLKILGQKSITSGFLGNVIKVEIKVENKGEVKVKRGWNMGGLPWCTVLTIQTSDFSNR